MSSGLTPAFAAGPSEVTVLTITPPLAKPYWRLTAEGIDGWKLIPMEPRVTLWSGPMSML